MGIIFPISEATMGMLLWGRYLKGQSFSYILAHGCMLSWNLHTAAPASFSSPPPTMLSATRTTIIHNHATLRLFLAPPVYFPEHPESDCENHASFPGESMQVQTLRGSVLVFVYMNDLWIDRLLVDGITKLPGFVYAPGSVDTMWSGC